MSHLRTAALTVVACLALGLAGAPVAAAVGSTRLPGVAQTVQARQVAFRWTSAPRTKQVVIAAALLCTGSAMRISRRRPGKIRLHSVVPARNR